ncbi:MAG TPA: DUF1697 domain-containing protein [Vicinamibacteria bacterium]|nr:DUF1697 domain-containing protein [Vicinamibacteria bacterium]
MASSALHVALLRGINVGGHKRVAMGDLRGLLEDLGFVDVHSLLQSGNLVFRTGQRRTPAQLERLLEADTEERLGLKADFLVRTAAEWSAIVARNPFPAEARRDPRRLLVMFLKEAPSAAAVEALRAGIVGREVVRADARQAYIVYPDGVGRSRLTHAVIERTLATRGTGRNWNTVLKLAGLVGA